MHYQQAQQLPLYAAARMRAVFTARVPPPKRPSGVRLGKHCQRLVLLRASRLLIILFTLVPPSQVFVCVGDYNGHIGLGVKVRWAELAAQGWCGPEQPQVAAINCDWLRFVCRASLACKRSLIAGACLAWYIVHLRNQALVAPTLHFICRLPRRWPPPFEASACLAKVDCSV